ncbi:MAG TPA: asparaginase [Anaerolineales bacterium]
MSQPRPLLELVRGEVIESTHYGHIAVVDAHGRLLASLGDPQTVAFLRSSAKPFQALPFVERGGVEHFGFAQRELALACASHEGSAAHIETVQSMQRKAGLSEELLQCGVHMPGDPQMFRGFVASGTLPTPNFNNCSGKHTAMLAHAKMRGLPLETYLDRSHPIQQDILAAFAAMCGIQPEAVGLGVDGCSAPNFAVPLYNAALAMARLCDPQGLEAERAKACRKITAAMAAYPEMVSAPGEFDCELMRAGRSALFTKRGAEGFQILGISPGVLVPDSPGVGIAFKVADGDASRMNMQLEFTSRVRPAVALEILSQLGVLSAEQQEALKRFGPVKELRNHRGILTGHSRPVFTLERHE